MNEEEEVVNGLYKALVLAYIRITTSTTTTLLLDTVSNFNDRSILKYSVGKSDVSKNGVFLLNQYLLMLYNLIDVKEISNDSTLI